jgi:hypothetical protein
MGWLLKPSVMAQKRTMLHMNLIIGIVFVMCMHDGGEFSVKMA